MARPNYRRRKGKDTWHFCTNWPIGNYDTASSKPSSGEFCNECLEKEKNRDCS